MLKYEKGLVSVIMPTYRRSEKLERAINSVLNQTYKNIELLLVNDNVTGDAYYNELIERVKKYNNDSRFKLILQKQHTNGAVARNVGIRSAKGEFIAFLDDDDWWKEDKIERQVNKLISLPEEWGGVSCRVELYDNERIITRMPKYKDGYVYKDILMLKSDFTTCSLLLKHEYMDKVGYFDENLIRHQDLQLLVHFTYRYKLYQMDEFLFCCDVSDDMNRPNAENIIKYKEKFFISVDEVMKTLSKRERRCVECINKFEIGYVFYLNKNIKKAIQYCIQIFRSPKALYIAIYKIMLKLKSKINYKIRGRYYERN